MSDKPDYKDTVFLPKTDFPMKAGLAQKEPAILSRWAETDLYGRLRNERCGRPRFILHDGPPYANGDIHMGHAMNKILKDIVVRSASLRGFDAPYVPGWDCHGLPIEWKIEEQYRKKKLDKDQVPAAEFRAECRAYADKWVGVQREQFQRLGVMGEWDDPYLTMKYESEAAIVAELHKIAMTGQLYRGAKPVMWSPVEKTALAEAEVEYEEIVSTQIDVAFEIVESPIPELVGAHAVVWTTTPWTIPVNQAIAYGPEVDYWLYKPEPYVVGCPDDAQRAELLAKARAVTGDRWYLIASDLEERLHTAVERYIASQIGDLPAGVRIDLCPEHSLRSYRGSDLAGTIARHPMANHLRRPGLDPGQGFSSGAGQEGSPGPGQARADAGSDEEWERRLAFFAKPRPFLPGGFVTTDQGTGLVHMAPDHGEDDFLLCKAHGIDTVFAVEDDGRYRADWAWLGGQGSVIAPKFNAPDGPICSDLRDAGALLAASADFRHSYPHSWRSKAKVIFRATPQWFIPMDRSAEQRVSTLLDTNGGRDNQTEPFASSEVEKRSLRATALAAIDETRWVPEKSRNRIRAMVEGRPDWVISRQRAWGVPIALYVHRRSGDYLRDEAVNARIVETFRAGGADAWFTGDHQRLLGNDYNLADYEPVTDILDVWFDSGSTHAYVIEERYGPGTRADIYVEGSDQHRGWFQSSLLESSATRGRAPYDQVLTHGFALDAQGRKMSKSIGNTVDPLAVIRDNGADILRLWVASTDYFEDVRIGKEVLAGTSDAYRKLRNTFRYLLGALSDFSDAERVDAADIPDLERFMLSRLLELDATLRAVVGTDAEPASYEFGRYVRALTDFANNELSAFFFDIRKDCLYCDAPDLLKRRAYRTVLDILFHALVRYAAPILVFTAEEVWTSRFPDAGSVHLLTWPQLDSAWGEDIDLSEWQRLLQLRLIVTGEIEPKRRAKELGSSLEAKVTIGYPDDLDRPNASTSELAELFIVSDVGFEKAPSGPTVIVHRSDYEKCGRCWRLLPEVTEDGALCARCDEVVNG
jgi:isoleucyl-tRNA synthetase